jgi:hypothetical protein
MDLPHWTCIECGPKPLANGGLILLGWNVTLSTKVGGIVLYDMIGKHESLFVDIFSIETFQYQGKPSKKAFEKVLGCLQKNETINFFNP